MQFVITSTKVLAEIHSMAKQLSKFFLLMDTSFVISSHASTLSICYCNSSSGASNPSLISPNFCRTTAFGLDNFISLHFGWGFISFQKLPKVSWYISSHDKLSLISWSFVIFVTAELIQILRFLSLIFYIKMLLVVLFLWILYPKTDWLELIRLNSWFVRSCE